MTTMRISRTTGLAVAAAIVLCLFPGSSSGETYDKKLGMGLMLGNPLGGNLKGWVNESQAIDGGIGLGFLGGEHLQVHATYLWHFDALKEKNVEMLFYAGTGPALDIKEDRRSPALLFLRVSAGLNFTFEELRKQKLPIDFFLEAAPQFGKSVKVDANLGVRYWF